MKNIRRKDIRNFLGIDRTTADANSRLINNLDKGTGIPDPNFLTFTLWFNCESNPNPYGVSTFSNLLLPETDVNSAINYLLRINRTKEAGYLREFREQLMNIQTNKPWYFQTISGLNELMLLPGLDTPHKREKDKRLVIECLESFDNQMTFLADLYHKAVYDMTNKKYLLPKNMRQFEARVIVTEIRDLFEIENRMKNDSINQTFVNYGNDEEDVDYATYMDNIKKYGDSWYNKLNSNFDADSIKSSVYEKTNIGNLPKESTYDDPQSLNTKFENIITSLQEKLTYKVFELYFCEFDFNKFTGYDSLTVNSIPEQNKLGFDIIPGLNFTTTQYGFFEWIISEFNKNFKTSNAIYQTNYDFENYEYIGWHNYTHGDVQSISKQNANLDEIQEYNRLQLNNISDSYDVFDDKLEHSTQGDDAETKKQKKDKFASLKQLGKSVAAKYVNELEDKYNQARLKLLSDIENKVDQFSDLSITDPFELWKTIKKTIDDSDRTIKEPEIDKLEKQPAPYRKNEDIDFDMLDVLKNIRSVNNRISDEIKDKSIPNKPKIVRNLGTDEEKNPNMIKKLSFDSAEYKQDVEQINKDAAEFRNDIDTIEKPGAEFREDIENISKDEAKFREDVEQVDKQPAKYLTEVTQINKDAAPYREDVEGIDKQPAKFREDVEQVDKQPAKYLTEVTQINKDAAPYREDVEQVDKQPAPYREDVEEIEKPSAPYREDVEEIEKQPAKFREDVEEIEKQPASYREDVDIYNSNILTVRKDVDDINKYPAKYRDDMDTITKLPADYLKDINPSKL